MLILTVNCFAPTRAEQTLIIYFSRTACHHATDGNSWLVASTRLLHLTTRQHA